MERDITSESKLINVKWVKLERDLDGNVLNAPSEAGVYTFIFNKYPFYFGTAEKGNLKARLKKHGTLFKSKKRTYLDWDYFSKHTPWTEGLAPLDKENFFKYVFVPDVSGVKRKGKDDLQFSEEQSLKFWKSFEIYFGIIENADKKIITTLEGNLQISFQNIYFNKHSKSMLIPGTISTFFGKVETGNFMNDYIFEFDVSELNQNYFKDEILELVVKEIPCHCQLKKC